MGRRKSKSNKAQPRRESVQAQPVQVRVVRSAFDAAQTNRHNEKHWSRADDLSADGAASAGVRKELRRRCRYEVANNSIARGMVLTLANDTVGTGPRLQMATGNDDLDTAIEKQFFRWCRTTNFFEKLRTMRMARVQDGEAFAIMAMNPTMIGVQLDLQLIEAEQITSDSTGKLAANDIDGVILDSFGNPVTYSMLTVHPGDGTPSGKAVYKKIPATDMIHFYRVDRPNQHRGLPEIMPALELYGMLRRFSLATLAAAETAADFAGILKTSQPASGEAAQVDPFGNIQLDRNMLTFMPEGWDLQQMQAEHPATTYEMFKREIVKEIARCLNMPYNVAAGDSSGYNYASGQLDWQTYAKAISVDQSQMESAILDRVFSVWYRELALIDSTYATADGQMPDHTWFWDTKRHVDPTKEASAQAQFLANGTTNLFIECAKVGKDWKEVIDQRAREMEYMKLKGLSIGSEQQKQDDSNTDDGGGSNEETNNGDEQ